MCCTFGSAHSVMPMLESLVCGYLSGLVLSLCVLPLHCISLIKCLRWRQWVVQAFTRACLKWLLRSSDVYICLSGVMGWMSGGEGGSKIWQIAENCLQTVIPVWTHLAHLVVIWQQKCRGGGLSSQSGATYYSFLLLLLHFISSGLVCKHRGSPPPPPQPPLCLCGVLGADGVCSDASQLSCRSIP